MSDRETISLNWSFWLQWVLVTTLGWVLGVILFRDVGTGAVMGALQWVVLRPFVRRASWWILVSAVGWEAGRLLVVGLFPPGLGILYGAVIGAALAVFQWAFLRTQLHRAGWWVPVSALGWAVALSGAIGAFWVGAVAGFPTGFALELLLRSPRLDS